MPTPDAAPHLQRAAAESVLKQLQQNPDAWQRVDTILETSQSQQSKFFAMQVSPKSALPQRHAGWGGEGSVHGVHRCQLGWWGRGQGWQAGLRATL